MKKIVFFILLGFELVSAQTGIGTSTPHASAKLEVASSTQGFLPPRVALTALNLASPISNPANGLMVFNTASAGASPFNVVPGYYYWDGTGQQWVSLSTTVGNVMNQAIFRSTANTSTNNTAINSWNSRFNNIPAGDLSVSSSTTFTLSNGIYKIQWGLPHQQSNTYNLMSLQENISGTWTAWRGDVNLSSVANGGNTDWGGASFMTDIIDCSSTSKTIRLVNSDALRVLFYGASFIITKLNPSITTSTTADNLGSHTATQNILLNGNFISNDGGNEGIRVDNNGRVGIGTTSPTVPLEINGAVNANTLYLSNSTIGTPSLVLRNGDAATAFSDIPQIRMGWSGSEPGTSQFSQMIHTRHNSGSNNNAIDFYLSDGTRNNTITSGSTRAMTITSPGNVEITGRLNVGDPTGNVATKIAARVDAGVEISLDNLKARVTTSGSRGLEIGAVSGTISLHVQGSYTNVTGVAGTRTPAPTTYTTTFSGSLFGWSFAAESDTAVYHFVDVSNSRFYRVTLMIGSGYFNNFIAIERLL